MSYGTPVAAAQASSLPEILQDGANWFAPDDNETLEAIMILATDSPERLAATKDRGLAICQKFSWSTVARQTLEIYNRFPTL
jgi:glycosyltransferase involved in cell wall biosynthesis